jgi:hypothetical protein
MKQTITILGLFFCLAATAQKKDTTIQVTMPIEQFRSLMIGIDVSIDSKKASKEIIDFLVKSAAIVPNKQDSLINKTPKK